MGNGAEAGHDRGRTRWKILQLWIQEVHDPVRSQCLRISECVVPPYRVRTVVRLLTRATRSQSRSTAMGGWPCGSGSETPLTAASADDDGGGSSEPTAALGGGSVTPPQALAACSNRRPAQRYDEDVQMQDRANDRALASKRAGLESPQDSKNPHFRKVQYDERGYSIDRARA